MASLVRDAARRARLLTMRVWFLATHNGLIPRRRVGAVSRDGRDTKTPYTAAMQSISISNGPNHCGTQTKMRAGGLSGKYRA